LPVAVFNGTLRFGEGMSNQNVPSVFSNDTVASTHDLRSSSKKTVGHRRSSLTGGAAQSCFSLAEQIQSPACIRHQDTPDQATYPASDDDIELVTTPLGPG